MSGSVFYPPLCGCSDRSGYVRAKHKCETCNELVCKYCVESCQVKGHKTRKATVEEIGTQEDGIRSFGYPS